MRVYRDFILYTDTIEGAALDAKNRPLQYSLRVFDSPVGEGEHSETVSVDNWDELEAWRAALSKRTLEKADFETFAQQLGEMILPPYARQLYQNSLTQIWLKENEGLRVRLRLIHGIAHLPWEYALVKFHAYEPTPDDFWGLNFRISVVRHEAIAVPAPPFRAGDKRRVIVAMASPEPYHRYPKLDLAGEQRAIKKELEHVEGVQPEFRPDFDTPVPEAASEDTLRQLLLQPADIFHFSGHGIFKAEEGHGALVLADEHNQAELVEAGTLSGLLAEGHIRLVLMDACRTGERDLFLHWSSVALALLKGGIPAVVAMQFSVYEDLATEFARKIYEYLVAGLSIDEAVAQGRKAMYRKSEKTRDWGTPVLYLRNSGGNLFPPVSDRQARLAAEKTAAQDSTLSEVLMRWAQEGAPASVEQLHYLSQAGDSLTLLPLDALLLLRSALLHQQETAPWVQALRRVGSAWLLELQQQQKVNPEGGLGQKLLGLDDPLIYAQGNQASPLARAAALHPDRLAARTAALALVALAPDQAIAQLQDGLRLVSDLRQKRRRRAELLGTAAEAEAQVNQQLSQELDRSADRAAVWGWRARLHLQRQRPELLRAILGGAAGGALSLAAWRAFLALFNTLPGGTEFAIHGLFGFVSALGLAGGRLLAAPLLLQSAFAPDPKQRKRVEGWAVLLGALGFSLASAVVVWLNGSGLGLSPSIFLRFLFTTILVGAGLSLGLAGQPAAGWRLAGTGWARRLGIVALVLALVQLPVLCEGLLKSSGGYWLENAQWLAAPIFQPAEAISNSYPWLQTIFDRCIPGEIGKCCFACQGAAESVSNLLASCLEQWLSVLDTLLTGLLLCIGMTAGIHFSQTRLGKIWSAFKKRWLD